MYFLNYAGCEFPTLFLHTDYVVTKASNSGEAELEISKNSSLEVGEETLLECQNEG